MQLIAVEGSTHRVRTALRPRKAPSVIWLMELWPRRRVWRSPRTARLPSSRRVKLLYDRFLEEQTGDGRQTQREEVCVCEVWTQMTQLPTSLYFNFHGRVNLFATCFGFFSFPTVRTGLAEVLEL